MIAEKMESVLKAMAELKTEQSSKNYFIMKAAMQRQKEAISMVRRLESTPLGETAK